MRIGETRTRLLTMIAERGVTPESATAEDIRTVADTFRCFAAIPVAGAAPPEDDGDGVLAQFGTYAFRGSREFSVDLTRQLTEVGEDAPMWQVSCSFQWAASAETDALMSGEMWSFGMSSEDFFAQAMALPGWAWALDSPPPVRDLTVTLDET